MSARKSRAIETEKAEGERWSFQPRELERRPERLAYRDVPEAQQLEAGFRGRTSSDRVLGLPRVEGFERSGVISNEEVREFILSSFPERHANNVTMDVVKYSDQYEGDGHSTELGHRSSYELVEGTNIVHKDIVINRETEGGCLDADSVKSTLAHEVGHHAYWMDLSAEERGEWGQISGSRAAGECVSEYARTSEGEDFAESYMTYVLDPKGLESVSAERYRFMRDCVFGGREYQQREAGESESDLLIETVQDRMEDSVKDLLEVES